MTHPMRSVMRFGMAAAMLALAFTSVLAAQPVSQVRGIDSRVDYESLKEFGPWDDRNYQLTAEDVALLGSNEESAGPVPAFFRVEVRKAIPDLQR